ncbi:MAG: copper resistance CopC/CopD family protein [Gemmatimonadaceae bacterium]
MRTSKRLRSGAATIAALLTLAVIATPAVLFAHARLVRSTPGKDATLTTAPAALQLWFSERPELRFSTLALLDSTGAPMSLGALTKIAGDEMGLSATISSALPNGRYTVQWRTAAADGHATSGSFSFVVAARTPSAARAAAPVAADTTRINPKRAPNTVVETAPVTTMPAAVRWAELVAMLTIVGTVVFSLVVVPGAQLPPDVTRDARDRARRLANSVLVLFVITTLWRLSAQADLIPTASSARISAMMTVVRETGWGAGWLVGGVGAVIAAVGLVLSRRGVMGWIVAAIGAVCIAASEGLTGHAAASKQVVLAVAVDLAHVLGAGGWMGGLAAVTLCGLAATRRAEASTGGTRLSHQLIRAFHRSAIACVSIVLITSVAAIGIAWFRLGEPTVFWTSAYGSVLLLKMAFAVVLLVFGWYHWRTAVIPEWTDDTRFRFKRSVAVELLVGAGIVGVTTVLISMGLTRS